MTITLQVEGMMCAHCERRVTTALSDLTGITSCVANAGDKRVSVTFQEDQITEQAIKDAIDEIGYSVIA